MKRHLLASLSAMFIFSAVAVNAADVNISVNGNTIDLAKYGAEPYIEDSRVLLPIRAVAEALDAEVDWTRNPKPLQ